MPNQATLQVAQLTATQVGANQLPSCTTLLGNRDILRHPLLALFCSVRCPGNLILQTYDLARALRDAGTVIVGGFHTPMEKECLALLLRGTQPVVICPARGLDGMRLPTAWKTPLAEGRLLLLSPFPASERRVTADLAAARNTFVAHIAARVFVAHAAPGGRTHALCRDTLAAGKPLLPLDDPANAALITIGAHPIRHHDAGRIP